MTLFKGHEEAYGIYSYTDEIRADGKIKGKGTTVRDKVYPKHWEDHLLGNIQLGIIPITDENKCKFGAIDIDDYGVNRELINKQIRENDLPLIQFRSKSGGAHLFLFTTEFVSARLMQIKLKEMAAFLGFGNSEIFPKQIQLIKSRGDVGGWINMPYYNANRTDRYAIDREDKKLTPAEFIVYAHRYSVTKEFLETIKPQFKQSSDSESFSEAPPCLQHLALQGFPEGTRNNGLFNAAIYLKKANPDTWKPLVETFNAKHISPQLTPKEVLQTIASVDKKDYFYTCKQQPICAHCNTTLCRTRKYGIGDSQDIPMFSSLTKSDSDPPIWFVDVEGGGRLELTTDDLQNPIRLQKKCLDTLNVMIPLMERKYWSAVIQQLLKGLTVVDIPKEQTPRGRLMQLLEDFCISRSKDGDDPHCLFRGMVYNDQGKHHFRFSDFMDFLDRKRFVELGKNKILALFKDENVKNITLTKDRVNIKVCTISLFKVETEMFTPPRQTSDDIPF